MKLDGKLLAVLAACAPPPTRASREAYQRLPPALREGAERQIMMSEMLSRPRVVKKVFRRVP